MKRFVLLLGLTVPMACERDITEPGKPLVQGAIPAFTVVDSSVVRSLWEGMQRCTGLTGNVSYRRIHFYSVPGEFFMWNGHKVVGLWDGSRYDLFVADFHELPLRTIRHEMLHALLLPVSGHPAEWFGNGAPCGNLMTDEFAEFLPF